MHDPNLIDTGTFAALLGILMRDGYKWLRNGTVTTKLAVLEERLRAIAERLERIENKLDHDH